MNKERLAEIEERILKIDEDDSTNRSKMIDYRHWAYELLKIASEQAERVQELEEDCEYLSHHYGLEAEKNKRYREILKELKKDVGNTRYSEFRKNEFRKMLFYKIDKALEGEE